MTENDDYWRSKALEGQRHTGNMLALLAERDAEIAQLKAEREVYDTPAWEANERLNGTVNDLCAEISRLRAALKDLLAEWDKFSRYGSPIAKAANEAVTKARAALERSA
jgi:hypothetical protein